MQPDKNKDTEAAAMPAQQIVQLGKDDLQNGIPAHEAAEADIQSDPDFNSNTGADAGLDEGELARLEGEGED